MKDEIMGIVRTATIIWGIIISVIYLIHIGDPIEVFIMSVIGVINLAFYLSVPIIMLMICRSLLKIDDSTKEWIEVDDVED